MNLKKVKQDIPNICPRYAHMCYYSLLTLCICWNLSEPTMCAFLGHSLIIWQGRIDFHNVNTNCPTRIYLWWENGRTHPSFRQCTYTLSNKLLRFLFHVQHRLCSVSSTTKSVSRVAKCHGYGGYIRVKKLEGWGKKSGGTRSLAKSSVVLGKFEQLIWKSVFKPLLYGRVFSFCSPEIDFCVNFIPCRC